MAKKKAGRPAPKGSAPDKPLSEIDPKKLSQADAAANLSRVYGLEKQIEKQRTVTEAAKTNHDSNKRKLKALEAKLEEEIRTQRFGQKSFA